MKKTTSVDLSHVSSGPEDGRRVGPSRNSPVVMTDLQRRLMAGRTGLLELSLLRESYQTQVEETKRRLEDYLRRAAKTAEPMRSGGSRRSVSESCDGAPRSSSSSDEAQDVEDDNSSLTDDVFCSNPILSNPRIISTSLLATSPRRLPSNKTKQRRMSEFQQRGVASERKTGFCRTFNGIRLSAHRRRSEGACLGVQQPSPDIRLTDHYRKPVVISGLTFKYPSPLHAILSQFESTRGTRGSVGSGAGCPGPLHCGSDGGPGSTVQLGKGVGFRVVEPVRRFGRVAIGSESTLQLSQCGRERLALNESSMLTRASSNVDELSPDDDTPKRQDPELERSSSEEKEPEEQRNKGFDPSKEAAARPRLSRTTLYRLSEEGYFSGSDSQPGSVPEPPPRRRGKGGGRTSPKQSCSDESSRTGSTGNSPEDCNESKPETGSDPSVVQSEPKIETSSLNRLPIFC